MERLQQWIERQRDSLTLAIQALRFWRSRQIITALVAAIVVAVVIGIATVLIPNPLFARDIPPVWWNYPVWILTSLLTGVLIASYIRPTYDEKVPSTPSVHTPVKKDAAPLEEGAEPDREDRRGGRFALAGSLLAWFAVGCPVCNKIALLALGYTGALTWFAPLQPILAISALVFSAIAVVWRLKGQQSCPVPSTREASLA